MKIDFIVISLILVMLVFLPFILLPLIHNSDRKKLQKKSREESSKHGLALDQKENWSKNFIGIDSAQKKMLWIQKLENELITDLVNLSEVRSTKLKITEIEKNKDGKTEKILERIDLEFLLLNDEKKIIKFFDCDLIFCQDLEVMHAKKWNELIQKNLGLQIKLKKSA